MNSSHVLPHPPNSLHLISAAANNCNKFRADAGNGQAVAAATNPSSSLHLFPVGGNNCDTFGVGATRPLNRLHLFPVGGNNCDKFGVGFGVGS